MTILFPRVEAELADAARADELERIASRQVVATSDRVADVAHKIVNFARTWWWVDPRTVVDLASAGIDADAPEASQVAAEAAAQAFISWVGGNPTALKAFDEAAPRSGWSRIAIMGRAGQRMSDMGEAVRRIGADPAAYGVTNEQVVEAAKSPAPAQVLPAEAMTAAMIEVAQLRALDRFGDRPDDEKALLRAIPPAVRMGLPDDISRGALARLASQFTDSGDKGWLARGADIVIDRGLQPALQKGVRLAATGLDFPRQYFQNALSEGMGRLQSAGTILAGEAARAQGGASVGPGASPVFSPPSPPPPARAALDVVTGTGQVFAAGATAAAVTVSPPAALAAMGTQALVETAVSPGAVARRAAATDLGVELTTSLSGGWLPSEAAVRERQLREAAFSAYDSAGRRLTFGRTLAYGVGVDRWGGERAFNLVSGLGDAYIALRGPGELAADKAVSVVGSARSVPGVRSLPILGRFDPVRPSVLETAWRRSIFTPDAAEWANSWRGRLVARRLVNVNTTEEVMNAFKNKIPVSLASLIARATPETMGSTDDAARFISSVLVNSIEGGSTRSVPALGAFGLRSTTPALARWRWTNRLISQMPDTKALDMSDLEGTWAWARDFLTNALVPTDRRRRILDDLAAAANAGERKQIIFKDVAGAVNRVVFENTLARQRHSIAGLFDRLGTHSKPLLRHRIATMDERDRLSLIGALPAHQSGRGGKSLRAAAYDLRNDPERLANLLWEHRSRLDIALGRARRIAGDLTRFFHETQENLSTYFVDSAGRNVNPFAVANGEAIQAPVPHLLSELLSSSVPVPQIDDLRRIRNITSRETALGRAIGPLLWRRTGRERLPITLLDFATTAIWKPFVLLKGAYVVKVVADEQWRIAASGGDALTSSPLAWLAWMTGRKGISTDVLGSPLDDSAEFAASIVGPAQSWLTTVRQAQREGLRRSIGEVYTLIAPGAENYAEAWAGELAQLHRDDLARLIASGASDNDVIRWITENPKVLERLDALAEALGDNVQREVRFRLGENGEVPDDLRQYLRSLRQRIAIKTSPGTGSAPDPRLVEAIVSGEMRPLTGGRPIIAFAETGPSLRAATEQFTTLLADEYLAAGDHVGVVKALREVYSGSADNKLQGFRQVLQALGSAIIERPTTVLSRSPMFRQHYWKAVNAEAPNLTPEAAQVLLGRIPDGLPRDLRRSLLYRLGKAARRESFGDFDLEALDMLAKARAMDATNDVLVSMATKKQWHDMARIMAPFAQAWGEVITTWGRLLAANPGIVRRVNQALTVAHDPEFADILEKLPGWNVVDGHGLIYTNEFGQEMVVVPYAGAAAELFRHSWNLTAGQLPGAPEIPALPPAAQGNEGFVSAVPADAISIGTSLLPGVGPYVSIPLAAFIRDLPGDWQGLLDRLFPFGEPPPFSITGLAKVTVPSWVRALTGGFTGETGAFGDRSEIDSYNGKVAAAMQWLLQSGDYDLAQGESETARLLEDAKDIVRWSSFAAGMGAWLTFTTPRTALFLTDENGKVALNPDSSQASDFLSGVVAANIYRSYFDEATDLGLDFEKASNVAATRLIIEVGGGDPNILYTVIGKSRSRVRGGAPVSKQTWRWLQQHPEVRDLAPTTWQFFAPSGDDFYYPMYLDSIAHGERERLTPEQWLTLADDLAGSYQWATNIAKMESILGMPYEDFPDQARQWAAELRDQITEAFPGWNATVITPLRGKEIPQVIDELAEVVAPDGVFADHPNAQVIRAIIAQRQKLIDEIRARGISTAAQPFARSQATAPYRRAWDAWLRQIAATYPGVKDVVVSVFRAEVAEGLAADRERTNG